MGGALLEGKVALVTGAGSGIGYATALLMAAEGARVLCADRAEPETAVDAIRAAGGSALPVCADVTNEDDVAAAVAAAVAEWGRLDCAFNNAGIGPAAVGSAGQRVAELSRAAWDGMLAVNLTGVFLCLKHEVAAMARGGGGAIVNTASIAGLVGLPSAGAYVAAKHGVVGLTKAAAIDHAADGVRVNAVCPGYIDTPLIAAMAPDRAARITARKPLNRFGTAAEVAELVVWLCSDRAGFATGAAYPLDGGYTAA